MKIIPPNLWLEREDIERSGISMKYAIDCISKSVWEGQKDPSDARKLLVKWETLPDKYKDKVYTSIGDPWQIARRKPIERRLVIDTKEQIFLASKMGHERAASAAKSCALLRLYSSIRSKYDLKALNLQIETKEELLTVVMAFAKDSELEGLSGIENPKVFLRKLKDYQDNGAQVFAGKFGLANNTKICEMGMIILGELYCAAKLDSEALTAVYNKAALEQGLKEVSRSAVYRLINTAEFKAIYDADRHGEKAWDDANRIVVKRRKASFPTAMWMIDGTPMELYYKYQNKDKRWTLGRIYVVAVADAHNWEIVGVGYGKTETEALNRQALKNACRNKKLLPHQIQHDRGSGLMAEAMQDWMRQIAKYVTPTAPKNARGKTIEPMLRRFFDTQLRLFKNFSGLGVKSKRLDNQVNEDQIKANFKELPDEEGVIHQLNWAITQWNKERPAAEPIPNDMRRVLEMEMDALLFWEWRLNRSKERETYQYTNKGIQITIEGERHTFQVTQEMLPSIEFHLRHTSDSFTVKYDPNNLDCIWLHKEDKPIAFAPKVLEVAQAIVDYKEGEGAAIQALIQNQKQQVEQRKQIRRTRKDTAESLGINGRELVNPNYDPEAEIKAPFASPRLKHKDELNFAEEEWKGLNLTNRYDDLYSGEATFEILE
jgi:hypothetical protein